MDNLENLVPIWTEKEAPQELRTSAVDEDTFAEICYHEASHFVFSRYFFAKELFDKYPTKIQVSLKQNESQISFRRIGDAASNHDFVRGNSDRIDARIIQLLSGYLSYPLFVSDVEDWIGHIKEGVVTYSSINQAYVNPEISDFRNIKADVDDYLSKEVEGIEHLNSYIKMTREIFANDSIQEAIELVANELLESEDGVLEGEDIESLVKKVDELL